MRMNQHDRAMPRLILALLLPLVLLAPVALSAPIRVVAATADMGDLVRQLGGDRVEVHAITKGQYDLHFYEPRPSEVMKLKRADMVVVSGMELDAFMPGLIDASRNRRIRFGAPGFVDPSKGIAAHDVPEGRLDGRAGDVHPHGNPHHWFGPTNITIACSNIVAGLVRAQPDSAAFFQQRYADYIAQVEATYTALQTRLSPYGHTAVLQFHESWGYFCDCFGLQIVGSVESKPGIPPSAAHLKKLVDLIEAHQVKLILVEPFYPERPLRFLNKATGVRALRLPLLLGGGSDTTYLANLESMVEAIAQALEK